MIRKKLLSIGVAAMVILANISVGYSQAQATSAQSNVDSGYRAASEGSPFG